MFKVFAYGSTENHSLFLCKCVGVTHTLLLLLLLLLLLCVCMHVCVCVCVYACVCVCVCARAINIYTQYHTSMVVKTHELRVICSFKVSSCFLKPKLFNVFIDFQSFNFYWWIGPSIWRFRTQHSNKHYNRILPVNLVLQIQDIILPNPSLMDFYR